MKIESIIGFITLLSLIALSLISFDTSLAIRFFIGLAFGFVLVRASIGFAGSVNKLYRMRSASVAKTIILIFIITSIFTAFIISGNEEAYRLSIYPINLGLVLGGVLFGFGMAMSSCCATGSLTDIASGFSRAVVTIIFFALGVFLGFKIQAEASFVRESLLSSPMGAKFQGGVFLPDYFHFDGVGGYGGAIVITILFGLTATFIVSKFEDKTSPTKEENISLFDKVFVKPWTLHVSALAISTIFAYLLYYSHKGWSASSAFGIWFGKFLMLFGVEASTLSEFTTKKVSLFSEALLTQSGSLQNIGIVLGAVVALLIAGSFSQKFIAGLTITPKGALTFAVGGFLMGIGTRLSNGCNVGALYTPIAEFSLSGWIYLVFVVIGGVMGNKFVQRYISKSCSVV